MFTDHYKILNVKKEATDNEIKEAYRKLAFKFHPDVCHLPNAQSRFIEIQESYEILRHVTRRYVYDIVYDSYYYPTPKTESSNFVSEKKKEYEEYKKTASEMATYLSKERFTSIRDSILDGVGKTVEGTTNVLALIYGAVFYFGLIGGISSTYESVLKWDDAGKIFGFFVCSFLFTILTILLLFSIFKKD